MFDLKSLARHMVRKMASLQTKQVANAGNLGACVHAPVEASPDEGTLREFLEFLNGQIDAALAIQCSINREGGPVGRQAEPETTATASLPRRVP